MSLFLHSRCDFKVATASVQWVVTSYLMSVAICVPASGWLGDRFGTKRMYLIAVASFTFASLLCAASTNLPELVAMRIVQGIGGGMMVPVGMAMLYRAYPPERRVHVARLITRVMVLAPAMAPIIGGSLVTWASWRWIFTINLPFGVLAIAFGTMFLVEHREPREGTFDILGAITGAVGLGLLLYSVGSGPTNGWSSPLVLSTGAVAVASLGIFIRQELRRPSPLLNLGLLSNRMFRRSCALYRLQFDRVLRLIGLYRALPPGRTGILGNPIRTLHVPRGGRSWSVLSDRRSALPKSRTPTTARCGFRWPGNCHCIPRPRWPRDEPVGDPDALLLSRDSLAFDHAPEPSFRIRGNLPGIVRARLGDL